MSGKCVRGWILGGVGGGISISTRGVSPKYSATTRTASWVIFVGRRTCKFFAIRCRTLWSSQQVNSYEQYLAISQPIENYSKDIRITINSATNMKQELESILVAKLLFDKKNPSFLAESEHSRRNVLVPFCLPPLTYWVRGVCWTYVCIQKFQACTQIRSLWVSPAFLSDPGVPGPIYGSSCL